MGAPVIVDAAAKARFLGGDKVAVTVDGSGVNIGIGAVGVGKAVHGRIPLLQLRLFAAAATDDNGDQRTDGKVGKQQQVRIGIGKYNLLTQERSCLL